MNFTNKAALFFKVKKKCKKTARKKDRFITSN